MASQVAQIVSLLVRRFSVAARQGASIEADAVLSKLRTLHPGVRLYRMGQDLHVYCPTELVDTLPKAIRYTASYIEEVRKDGSAYVVKAKSSFRGDIPHTTEDSRKPRTWHSRLDNVFEESA